MAKKLSLTPTKSIIEVDIDGIGLVKISDYTKVEMQNAFKGEDLETFSDNQLVADEICNIVLDKEQMKALDTMAKMVAKDEKIDAKLVADTIKVQITEFLMGELNKVKK
jgi:hypothetical protein